MWRPVILSIALLHFLFAPTASGLDHEEFLAQGSHIGPNCVGQTSNASRDAWFAAITAAAEARAEGPLAMALVLEVIANRVCSGKYGGNTAEEVTTAPFQFSPWNPDSPIRPDLLLLVDGKTSQRVDLYAAAKAMEPIAAEVLKGWRTGLLPCTPGRMTLHFVNLQLARPRWINNANAAYQHGGHTFFVGVDRP